MTRVAAQHYPENDGPDEGWLAQQVRHGPIVPPKVLCEVYPDIIADTDADADGPAWLRQP